MVLSIFKIKTSGLTNKDKKKTVLDPDIRRLEEELSEHFAAPVRVESRDGKRGHVKIEYGSLDELDGILARIRRWPVGSHPREATMPTRLLRLTLIELRLRMIAVILTV